MTETYMRSSGSLEVYENGEQLHDMQYNAESDGNNIDFYMKNNNDEYVGQLDENARLSLFNFPATSVPLTERLEHDFPVKSIKSTKKSKKRARAKKGTKKK
jgi:hypothetical protein